MSETNPPDDEEQSEDSGRDPNNPTFVSGAREDRPAIDTRGAESTDWMAASELDSPDSDLTAKERRRHRDQQAEREEMVSAARPTVIEGGEERAGDDGDDERSDT